MTSIRLTTFILLLLAIGIHQAQAQLVISEYSASNMNQFEDDFEKFEDWIELHNSGSTPIDIQGYAISDKDDKPQKWIIPESNVIPPGGYQVVWCSGRDLMNGRKMHTNFKLTQSENKDHIVLTDPSGNIIESSPVQLTLLDHSRVKGPNGEWLISEEPTPAAAPAGLMAQK